MTHTCPTCRNKFVQPFVCTTCGAQKLRDHTMDTLEADLKRMRIVYMAAGRLLKNVPHESETIGYSAAYRKLACVYARAERAKGK